MLTNVLVVDDCPDQCKFIKTILHKENITTTFASSPAEALGLYRRDKMNFDLLLVDVHFAGCETTGIDLAETIRVENPHQLIVFMTGYERTDYYQSMLQSRMAKSFIQKGGPPESVLQPVLAILAETMRKRESKPDTVEDQLMRASEIGSLGIVGRSRALYEIVTLVKKIRRFKSRYLIIGPSGAGKESIAKAFRRSNLPFLAIDCARYSQGQEHFLESELYGQRKGAFTGADQDKPGAFEVANGGVVFLDELHCLSLVAQAKLLRTIQEMKCRRLGDTGEREYSFDVTIVAAAKPLIRKMIEDGTFMEDLYYRLAKVVIEIPALSERVDDIRPLALHFCESYTKKHALVKDLHPQLIREFESYSWPNNVRELENFVENQILTCAQDLIPPDGFRLYLESKLKNRPTLSAPKINLELVVDSVQTEEIISALLRSRTIGKASDSLGIPRTTLIDRMKRLKIDPHQYLGREP